ncbi:MAG: type II toxin-antitoxin system RelE/ParE family toxin [Rhodopirellula sp.]|nr:type II toxin-antitoxin system RelE/ParE family toxin [Rhodopirellula sp.]
MDRELIWSDAAVSDLESIAEYISRDSRAYAASFVRRIFAAAKSVHHMPESGGIVPEYNDGSLREVLVGSHRVVYSLHNSAIQIVAIIHGARQIRNVIDERSNE